MFHGGDDSLSLFQILWWDTRKLAEPVETLILDSDKKGQLDTAYGAMTLEYEPTIVSRPENLLHSIAQFVPLISADEVHGWHRTGSNSHVQSKRQE